MTTSEKFSETWTAITIIFHIWFPRKRKFLRWTADELESLHRTRYAIFNRVMKHAPTQFSKPECKVEHAMVAVNADPFGSAGWKCKDCGHFTLRNIFRKQKNDNTL